MLQFTLHMLIFFIISASSTGPFWVKSSPSLVYWTTSNKEKLVFFVSPASDRMWIWVKARSGVIQQEGVITRRRPSDVRRQLCRSLLQVTSCDGRLPAAHQPTVHLCLCVRRGAFILTAPPAVNSPSAHLYVSWWVQGHSLKAECVKVFLWKTVLTCQQQLVSCRFLSTLLINQH